MTLREPTWDDARAAAFAASTRLPTTTVALQDAMQLVLAAPLVARVQVPGFDTAMMDGWAVAGTGPWQVHGRVLAGTVPEPLATGFATGIATGAPIPPGATAVLRREWGRIDGGVLVTSHGVRDGEDIRVAGDEARAGDVLMPAGTRITPPVIGLAALVGLDRLEVFRRATVQVLVLGDEIATSGLPGPGKVRDALGVQAAHWSSRFGTDSLGVTHVRDTLDAHVEALRATSADIVYTTGGTARGPVDHMHAALEEIDARLLVDEVRVRPGHPMLLAQFADGRFLVGLPGNPLAAVTGHLTFAEPLLHAMHGQPLPDLASAVTDSDISAPGTDVRIIPALLRAGRATPTVYWGSAMLRGIAESDCMLVTPAGGAGAGETVRVLPLPW